MKQSNPENDRLFVLGITGGIGCGKSEVMKLLEEEYGAYTIRLDEVSRDLLTKEGACYNGAVSLFGPEIVMEDGSLNRASIAEKIFGNESLRTALDNLIHPMVKKKTEELLAECRDRGIGLAVIEAALLLEEHYDEICREVWYIYAVEAVRYERLIKSRGYSKERIRQTIRRQMSEEEFRRRCDVTIDNSASFSETREAVRREMLRIREEYQ